MKRGIYMLLAITAFFNCAYAQDTIVEINGGELHGKVTEVNKTDVKYRRFDNADGPVYSLDKSEIAVIKYASGAKDVFNESTAPAAAINAGDSDDVPGLFSAKISEASAGNLVIDNRKKLSKAKPDPEWETTEVTLSTLNRFYENAGFGGRNVPRDFFSTIADKTVVTISTGSNVFVAMRMYKATGKVFGSSQFYINGTNVMFPTGVIARAIYFKDAGGVEYHAVDLATAICQDFAKNGASTVAIIQADGTMIELIFNIQPNSPATIEFYAIFHPAGSFNPADYNIKFYPNSGLTLKERGTLINRSIGKYRIFGVEQ